ncbi:MAG: hypothetical protein LC641_05320 [Spirochaeta sp.]|nr:hypothetical protein [Spirochaeta sp.]
MAFDGPRFEAEVLRIARALWPSAEHSGPVIREGRERDGEFDTEEVTHLIECTIERKLSKAEEDIGKLRKRIASLRSRNPRKLVKGWFITLHEPTADQRGVAERAAEAVEAISFEQFRARLVDAQGYLQAREAYPFGSMRDPGTDSTQVSLTYVPVGMRDEKAHEYSLASVVEQVDKGSHLVILGEYGAGKSTTLRELFRRLVRQFRDKTSAKFPILLNLRDHHGQTDPVEAIERHARAVGYASPHQLVRAWRGGYVDLLLDGFDEIAVGGWAGGGKNLKDLRYRSMELVRRFLRDSPRGVGVVIAGRSHYFDALHELRSALRAPAGATLITLEEFDPSQISEFLRQMGWKGPLPEWVPARPLLLGYLASKQLLEYLGEDLSIAPAPGWDELLDRIAQREAELEVGVRPELIRQILEGVATVARGTHDGLGPVYPAAIEDTFRSVVGYDPDDRAAVLLQRLPGLAAPQSEDGGRVFIDRDFAEACKGSALGRYIELPFQSSWDASRWESALQPMGVEIASLILKRTGKECGLLLGAWSQTLRVDRDQPNLLADLLLIAGELGCSLDKEKAFIREAWIPRIALAAPQSNLSKIEIQDAVIGELEFDVGLDSDLLPKFTQCQIGQVVGSAGKRDLPNGKFEGVQVLEFEDSTSTVNAILALSLPLGVRVGMTILKKLYKQSGRGRREGALYRGLDATAQRIVPDVLDVLRRYSFAVPTTQGSYTVWLPTRIAESRTRALKILDSPSTVQDPLLTALRGI